MPSVSSNVASNRSTGCSSWISRSPVKRSNSQIPIGSTASSQPVTSGGGDHPFSSSIATRSVRSPSLSSKA